MARSVPCPRCGVRPDFGQPPPADHQARGRDGYLGWPVAGIYRGRTAWAGERWWMVCGCGGHEIQGEPEDRYADVQAAWNDSVTKSLFCSRWRRGALTRHPKGGTLARHG